MASAGIYPRDNWALFHCTVTWLWLPKCGALVSSITLIKQEFCVVNNVILIYLRYLHGYNASPDAHLSNTLVRFNRPTVCNIAHKNLDFFQLLLKNKVTTVFYKLASHVSRKSWNWMWAICANDAIASFHRLSPTFSFLSIPQVNVKDCFMD